jgi:hypothetical protein
MKKKYVKKHQKVSENAKYYYHFLIFLIIKNSNYYKFEINNTRVVVKKSML